MIGQGLFHTLQRYRTLHTDRISVLPIVILMPHSACNCRCVMCDIWKDNKNLKQLTVKDVEALLNSLKKFGTQQIVMSGGEALLNVHFFTLCRILKEQNIKITLLSTGLSIKKHAVELLKWVDDLIVSLDGDEKVHDLIRDIPGAFRKLKEGVEHIRELAPEYRITSRTVIHRLNFQNWPAIIEAGKQMGLNQMSFLPADVSSQAFNRPTAWSEPKQHEILPEESQLPLFQEVINQLPVQYRSDFADRFIAESPTKIQDIYRYYAAFYGYNDFPFKKCNAPWVSTVIEADGSVRPCFFHEAIGTIREQSLEEILNNKAAVDFRKTLNVSTNATCVKCVCSLNLSPFAKLN
ncbi:radical SAM/SPASM domain-containing protein [Runella sp.]|uniref:radical SAM protein n=1 Tax=Runella sp. TaxID=1960881 RepID=UPI003D0C04A8